MVILAQRYARAAISGNLKNDEYHYDTDVLAAMALSSTYGGLLFRVKYCYDAASYHQLLAKWTWIVSTKAVRRKWPDNTPIDKIASLSLNRWLNSVCPACTGRKNETIFNTPTLSDKECRLCNGTGETELRCNPRIRDFVLDMIEELFCDQRKAAERAIRKRGRPVD